MDWNINFNIFSKTLWGPVLPEVETGVEWDMIGTSTCEVRWKNCHCYRSKKPMFSMDYIKAGIDLILSCAPGSIRSMRGPCWIISLRVKVVPPSTLFPLLLLFTCSLSPPVPFPVSSFWSCSHCILLSTAASYSQQKAILMPFRETLLALSELAG